MNRKLKVLNIDNLGLSAIKYKVMLGKEGHEVLNATNGTDGVAIWEANPEIDLIWIAIRLPYIDGLKTISRIRWMDEGITIIAYGAPKQFTDNGLAYDMGWDYFVQFPLTEQKMQSVIHFYFGDHNLEMAKENEMFPAYNHPPQWEPGDWTYRDADEL